MMRLKVPESGMWAERDRDRLNKVGGREQVIRHDCQGGAIRRVMKKGGSESRS